jgi:hypothetical protein
MPACSSRLLEGQDFVGGVHPDAHVAQPLQATVPRLLQGEVEGGLGHVELGVARLLLGGGHAEERGIETRGLFDVVDVEGNVHFAGHGVVPP